MMNKQLKTKKKSEILLILYLDTHINMEAQNLGQINHMKSTNIASNNNNNKRENTSEEDKLRRRSKIALSQCQFERF